MNVILKFIAGVCLVTSLAMSGCIDSVTVGQNGTVTIDPANAASANVNVETVSDTPETPVIVEDEVDKEVFENNTDLKPDVGEGEEVVKEDETEDETENNTSLGLAGEDREEVLENSTDLDTVGKDAENSTNDAEEVAEESTVDDSLEVDSLSNISENTGNDTEEGGSAIEIENATINNETVAEVEESNTTD